jgi:hypothetical protein
VKDKIQKRWPVTREAEEDRKNKQWSHAPCARLLSATAVERMAVVSGVAVVPNARIAGVALTGLHRYKAVAAMGKTLELDGGKRVLRKQEVGRAHNSDEPPFHTFLHAVAQDQWSPARG